LLTGLVFAGESFALPPCPASGYFDNCYGRYTLASGVKYVGEWKDGNMHGEGVVTALEPGARKIMGEWKFDKLWSVVVYDASGQFVLSYKNGVPQ